MSVKHRYKWMELRHGKLIEPDPIHDIWGKGNHEYGETEWLNGAKDGAEEGDGYYSRGEAVMDLQRIDEVYPERKEEYVLIEVWTKGCKE